MFALDDLQTFAARGWRLLPIYKIVDGECVCRDGRDCSAPGKHPRTYNGVKGATSDRVRIAGWFQRFPSCNWAVATGIESGVWVLDVDVHQEDGTQSLKDWLIARGVTMPDTFTVFTGGGGWHFYWRADDLMPNQTGVLPGVDVRGDGGYVLLPGSNHASGGTYLIANRALIGRAPRALIELIRSSRSVGGQRIGKRGGAHVLAHGLDYYLEHGFTPGNRDNECYALACSLWWHHWNNPTYVRVAIADCWRATSQAGSPFPWTQAERKILAARRFIGRKFDEEAQIMRQFVRVP